uniref:Uncharacterized protein MANES_13G078500 n=3 Tax=Rhizophora mucronata TaxID=61149 RepID=A0A2P2KFE5_RHIMU
MASELVNSATSDKLTEVDWAKNIEVCELVACDQRQTKDVVKAIKKRLGSKHPSTQLYAVMLLEMLMNNIGDSVHQQVINTGVLPILVKIVKKKTELPVRERIFLLLDATQTAFGGAAGKFPQYYSAYFDLVSAGVKFPQRHQENPSNQPTPQGNGKSTINGEIAASRHEAVAQQARPQVIPESSIIQKASNALEVLKEVLDAVNSQNPESAKDEFTLDLVEQCSFQKQRVMHLVMTSRDEKLVSQAIELNEQLQKVLTRHDALVSGRPMLSDRSTTSNGVTSSANHFSCVETEEEEEETEQLFRRLRKGKACARPEDEGNSEEHLPLGFLGSSMPGERLNRPLIRLKSSEQLQELSAHSPPSAIPPPPSKHVERERFFKEKKVDGSALSGHMGGLSLHSRNASSSCSGSIDFSD